MFYSIWSNQEATFDCVLQLSYMVIKSSCAQGSEGGGRGGGRERQRQRQRQRERVIEKILGLVLEKWQRFLS